MRHALASQAFDIGIRIEDEGLEDIAALVHWHEFSEGVVFDDGTIRVSALKVRHPPVEECYALKVETAARWWCSGRIRPISRGCRICQRRRYPHP